MARASIPLLVTLCGSFVVTLVTSCGAEESPADQAQATPAPKAIASLASGVPAPAPRPLPAELKLVYREILAQRYVRARELANQFLKSHPQDAQALLMIGLSHFKADNHGAARPFLERALELAPDYYITHDYLAETLFLLGDLRGARQHFEAFGTFVPQEPKTYVRLGMIDFEEGNLEHAAAHFHRALALFEELRVSNPRVHAGQSSELAGAHARLGDVHFANGNYVQARDQWLEATRISPSNISAFFTLSLAYRRLGEDQRADEALERYESARRDIIEQQRQGKR
ncbi:MAG: tetratricopeptide (TPR) repeat protein [Candidatus Paceibacteria bacterium]|jgi:tetratricopeptide (TPR) repeat protein